jgi:hypothetical protein
VVLEEEREGNSFLFLLLSTHCYQRKTQREPVTRTCTPTQIPTALPSTIKVRHERILRAKPKPKPPQPPPEEVSAVLLIPNDCKDSDDDFPMDREGKDVSNPLLQLNQYDYKSDQVPFAEEDLDKVVKLLSFVDL